MRPATRRLVLSAVLVAGLLYPAAGFAQDPGAPLSRPTVPVEHVGIGVAPIQGFGWGTAALRLSLPLGSLPSHRLGRFGLDVDIGHFSTSSSAGEGPYGTLIAAQLRICSMRRANGFSFYALAGPLILHARTKMTYKFPGEVIVRLEDVPITPVQTGVGWDWLSKHGTRVGMELHSGGGEALIVQLTAFLVWGPAVR